DDPNSPHLFRPPMLDLDFVRRQFPALDSDWALMDNAGGSAPCRGVIDAVCEHMERRPVQLGASYPLSRDASAAVDAGRASAAALFRCEPDEIVLGPSSTALVNRLARVLRAGWSEGDEVIVTNVDHETNVGAWRRLEETGIVVREWQVRGDTCELHADDLDALLGERTRLVAFTHCSNIVGSIVDVKALAARARAAGALTCVDAVAYAPHRRVDVRDLGVDYYFASLYKIYGPHVAALYGRRDLLHAAKSPNHFFVSEDAVPTKLEPGGTVYELVASIPRVCDYLESLAEHHGGARSLDDAYDRIAAHEEETVRPLLAFLDSHPRVSIVGRAAADRALRVPTVSFVVDGKRSSEITEQLDERRIAARFGHFYAYRLIRDLGFLERDGVVRVSLVHYTAPEEVGRLVEALGDILG
ncbi:MAG: cysteine desulfurase-like protein, partial [Planctomycetota bacterium]